MPSRSTAEVGFAARAAFKRKFRGPRSSIPSWSEKSDLQIGIISQCHEKIISIDLLSYFRIIGLY